MRRLLLLGLVLAGAALAPGGAGGVGPNWKALERPLHLPKLAPGGGCPTSKLAPQITAKKYGVGGALGRGRSFDDWRDDLGYGLPASLPGGLGAY